MAGRHNFLQMLLGGSLLMGLPATAFAQRAPAVGSSVHQVEELVVTGTHIKSGADMPTPVTTLSADAIANTGYVDVADVLFTMPSIRATNKVSQNSEASGSNGGNGGLVGTTFLDLRGMGSARTLVLVDGLRHVGSGGAGQGSQRVDINTIPTDLIERVDVVTGGDSAIYGADAVTGVVNFIMKKNYQGFTVNAQAGAGTEVWDYQNYKISVLGGQNFADGRGNVTAFYERSGNGQVAGHNRSYAAANVNSVSNPASLGPTDSAHPTFLVVPNVCTWSIGPGGIFLQNATTAWTFDNQGNRVPVRIPTLTIGSSGQNIDSSGTCPSDNLQIVPTVTRDTFAASARYQVNSALELFGDAKYVRAEAHAYTQPFTSTNVSLSVATNPYLSAASRAAFQGSGVSTLKINYAFHQLGREKFDDTRETERFVVGARGDILPALNLSYTAALNYGQTTSDLTTYNAISNPAFTAGVNAITGPAGQPVCANGDPTCVPIDLLGPGALTPAMQAYIGRTLHRSDLIRQETADLNFSGDFGEFFKLPGGPLAFAFGGEYRSEYSKSVPDPLQIAGQLIGSKANLQLERGKYTSREAYLEINAPLLADIPFVKKLSFDGAVRVAKNSQFGSDTSWNLAADYMPIDDLKFRATVARAARAPNISEAFGGQTTNFSSTGDPCAALNLQPARAAGCAAAGVPATFGNTPATAQYFTTIITGGNPSLKPEIGDTYTVGVVLRPRFIPNLTATIDYFNVKVTNAVGTQSAAAVLNNCYGAPSLNNPFCALVTRDPTTHQVTLVRAVPNNIAKAVAQGVDYDISYHFGINEAFGLSGADHGAVTLRLTAQSLLKRVDSPLANNRTTDIVWRGYNGYPVFSADLATTYTIDKFAFNWNLRFINGTRDYTAPDPSFLLSVNTAPNVVYNDFQVRMQARQDISLYAGVNNAFDVKPPFGIVYASQPGSNAFDNIGRAVYVGVKLVR
jgi:iron complex outermembrane receptor protein